jgi:hypothetical protein
MIGFIASYAFAGILLLVQVLVLFLWVLGAISGAWYTMLIPLWLAIFWVIVSVVGAWAWTKWGNI